MNRRPLLTLLLPAGITLLAACSSERASDPLRPHLGGPLAMSFANSEWSEPVHLPAPINSPYGELAARLSPDELSIYFGSDRPDGYGGMDLWVSRRACLDCPWGEPAHFGPEFNSVGGDGEATFSPDGLLVFFTSSRPGGAGGEDVWMASRTDPNDDFGWGPPVNIGPDVNTPGQEGGAAYMPALEGSGVNFYFVRAGDIWQTRVTREGRVVAPVTPVAELNDPVLDDWGPTVRADGREVFFWRVAAGAVAELWVARRLGVHEPWSTPERLGPPVNTPFADQTPGLSLDGRTLLFSEGPAARPGLGRNDIWMATRTPSGN